MGNYAVTLTVHTEAESAEQAAEAFGWYVADTKHYSVIVDNLDTDETDEIEI